MYSLLWFSVTINDLFIKIIIFQLLGTLFVTFSKYCLYLIQVIRNLRHTIFFLLLFTAANLYSQRVGKIDFYKIKKNITNQESNYFYPSLLARIWANDTTLTYNEYKHLYYGNVFQTYYHPYGASFLKKDFNEVYAEGNALKSIKKGLDVLAENPVDIEVTLKILLAYLELGEREMARIFAKKYYGFLDVIYASGDGESLESAYVVISVDDEYRVVGDLGLSVKQQTLIDDCDLLVFVRKKQPKYNGKKIKQLYFNVRLPLLSLSSSFKDADLPDPDADPDEDSEEDQ